MPLTPRRSLLPGSCPSLDFLFPPGLIRFHPFPPILAYWSIYSPLAPVSFPAPAFLQRFFGHFTVHSPSFQVAPGCEEPLNLKNLLFYSSARTSADPKAPLCSLPCRGARRPPYFLMAKHPRCLSQVAARRFSPAPQYESFPSMSLAPSCGDSF